MLPNNQPEFTGIHTLLGFEHTRKIEDADLVFYGVPSEMETDCRPGCRLGPGAIRRYSSCKPYHEELDFNMLDGFKAVDYGDLLLAGWGAKETAEQIRSELLEMLGRTRGITIGVGGDHGIIRGELDALKDKFGSMALVLFSSRTNLWSDCCPPGEHCMQLGMRGGWENAHILDAAFARGVEVADAGWMHDNGMEKTADRVRTAVGDMPVFVSFDMGFLDPAFAPGAGSPAVGGFSVAEALKLIRRSFVGLDIVGMNLTGLSPLYDPAGSACVAAWAVLREFTAILSYNKKHTNSR